MLIALASVKGSPGVTTFTVALAARWPGPARRLVAECDPAGGDLALRFGLAASPGLVSLAAAARRPGGQTTVWEHTQWLSGGTGVIAAPPGGVQARAALHALVTSPQGWLLHQTAREPGVVVFADCGRLDTGSPAEAIAHRADVLVLLSGAHGDDLAHLAPRLPDLGRFSARRALLLAGPGHGTGEVEHELGIPAMGRIPHDPAAAAVLAGRAAASRRRGGALARCATAVAHALQTPAAGRPQGPGNTPRARDQHTPGAPPPAGGRDPQIHGGPPNGLQRKEPRQ